MSCAVPGCKSHSSRKQNDDVFISYHRFPKSIELKKIWLLAIKKQEWGPDNRRICSKHFTLKCFENKEDLKWRRLKPEAVPTLLLPQDQESFEAVYMQPNDTPCTSSDNLPLQDLKFDSENIKMEEDVTEVAEQPRLGQCSPPLPTMSLHDIEINRLKAELERSNKRLSTITQIAKRRLRNINALKQKNRRMNKKIVGLNMLLDQLLKDEDINDEHSLILKSFQSNEIIKRLDAKSQGDVLPREYPLEFKKFAVSLHRLSPKAYDLVRNEFDNVLPHPKTILSWYKGIDCDPGLTSEALSPNGLSKLHN